MEFNTTIDLIIKDLNDACQIIDYINNYPGVPELQVELAKAKCKSAGDVIALLKNIKHYPTLKSEVREPEKVKGEDAVKVNKIQESVVKPVVTAKVDVREPEPVPEKEIPAAEETVSTAEAKTESGKGRKPVSGSSIFADQFVNTPASINEQLGSRKGDDDFPGVIKSKPIPSLKEAIGINDRFLFIREIFNGDKETYNNIIAKLDETKSFSDAKALISGHASANADNEAVRQLLDLVKRKINPNE